MFKINFYQGVLCYILSLSTYLHLINSHNKRSFMKNCFDICS